MNASLYPAATVLPARRPAARPLLATLGGVAALIPLAVLLYAVLAVPEPGASQVMSVLLGYGAVALGFLGGLHFVAARPATLMVMDGEGVAVGGTPVVMAGGGRRRMALGLLPPLVGWAALIVPLLAPAEAALAVLALGFLASIGIEARSRRGGLELPALAGLRWTFCAIAAVALLVLLALRLLGYHLNF